MAGSASAFVDSSVAKVSTPSQLAVALEGVHPVYALAVLARVVVAVVDVDLAAAASETGHAVAQERGEGVTTAAAVEARIFAAAVIFVHLAVLCISLRGMYILCAAI